MRRSLAVASLVLACTQVDLQDTSDSDGADPRAVLVAEIEVDTYCDIVGAIEVVVRATQVGCEAAGPCTLPTDPVVVEGDTRTCPATESSALLGVEVGAGGRYAVETVAVSTTQEEEGAECYALPGETTPVLVTTADVESGAHIMLAATGAPCP